MSTPGRSVETFGDGAASANATETSLVPAAIGTPHLQLVVGGHPILVQTLALEVVLRNRNQLARIRTRKPSADGKATDQRVIDPDFDLVLVLGNPVDGLHRLVSLEPDGERILPVEREVVAHREATVRGEGQVLTGPDVATGRTPPCRPASPGGVVSGCRRPRG